MKKTTKFTLFALSLVLVLASGCPVGLDYPLGEPGTEKIEKALIGTWHALGDAEVQKATIERADDYSYKVTVLERGEMYALETDNLTGWVTSVKEKNFIFFKPEGEEKYYHYCYWFDGKTLVTTDVALLDGGIDAVSDTKSLRNQVASSMNKDEWGKEVVEWTQE